MIEVEELTKRYGTTTAVDQLSFTVRPGHVTGFLGPNGAGKTTTLRMLLGLIEPSGGTATVGGQSFRRHSRGLRHVGALLDAGDVHGGRTARAHLASLARGNRIPRERVDEVLAEVGLAGPAARRRIVGYSLGMRQRLGIATALLGDPPVLLFDEPLNGLDPEGVLWVRRLFRRLASEGRTVLVSSHLMSEMEHTADELVVIGRGRLIAAEPLKTFAARGTRSYVRVRTPDPGALESVLVAEGAEVTSFGDRDEPGGHNERNGHNAYNGPTLTVTGISPERIGDLALQHRLPIHELALQRASLEAAFMELTADSAEFLAGDHR